MKRLPVITLLISLLVTAALPLRAEPFPVETWLGMYLGKLKIGYTQVVVEKTEFKGKPSIKTQSVANTEMIVLGSKMTQNIVTTVYNDTDMRPIYEEFEMSSGGKTTRVYAEFLEDRIECRMVTAAGEKRKTIPIPPGAKLTGDSYSPIPGSKPVIGQTFERKSFNPLSLTLEDQIIKVEREEEIEIAQKKHKAVVIITKSPMADLTTYQSTESGDLLRIDAAMGISMIRETKEQALAIQPPSGGSQGDFAALTSVRANMDLPVGTGVKRLQIKLSGIPDPSFIFSDERQIVQHQTPGWPTTVTYLIRAMTPSASGAASLPVDSEEFKPFLRPGAYIDSDSETIAAKAAEIVGDQTNIVKAALKIRKWINKTVKAETDKGILRPASDVLSNPTGVCRDYAVLFSALARAVKIPTRIAGGLVYSRGDFYYHVWNEVWTGDAWVSFDSSTASETVDATHIKLTEGGAEEMFRIAKIMGQLKAEILEYQ